MASLRPLKTGEVVYLASGGPGMTVEKVSDDNHTVTCFWFDGAKRVRTEIPDLSLTVHDPSQPRFIEQGADYSQFTPPPAEGDPFNPGDLVCPQGDGPGMTVKSVGTVVICQWFGGGKELYEDTFPPETIRHGTPDIRRVRL
jgi:uncharacterized protein YodC (DUF2158 family)